MASIHQQRIWAFLAGVGVAGATYASTKALVWQRAAEVADTWPNAPPPAKPLPAQPELFDPKTKALLVRRWNQGVDKVFTPAINYLSERGL